MEFISYEQQSEPLWRIHDKSLSICKHIQAAVAYVSDEKHLIKDCFEKNIKLEIWARYDYTIPVNPAIMRKFLWARNPNYALKLVSHPFHSKVIWWHRYGAYVGSANLSDPAWFKNIEAGLFFTESEMLENGLEGKLEEFFGLPAILSG